MDFSESTAVVFNRIQRLEPEYVSKIIGYLLVKGFRNEEMIRLAFGLDNLIQMVVQKVKMVLGLIPHQLPPVSPIFYHFPSVSPSTGSLFHSPSPMSQYLQQGAEQAPQQYYNLSLPNQALGVEKQEQLDSINSGLLRVPGDYYQPHLAVENLNVRMGKKSPVGSEYPPKICQNFIEGFCKLGSSCMYLHEQVFPAVFRSAMDDDHILSPGSLDKLELELRELLKPRRGNPVSIASLPMMYYARYGTVLQAEGYLTESQRQGKAGYSLTKLLSRLRTIRILDRPHGQHSVILVEDIPKYMESRSERSDVGPIVSDSRQIYLTFPAESTFTEAEAYDYFSTFGTVEEVWIPSQQKRMYGFITFNSSETVMSILAKGSVHYVTESRVLVKPYREKPRFIHRKYSEKVDPSSFYPWHCADMDSELPMLPIGFETKELLRQQIPGDQEFVPDLEFETRRLSNLQLAQNPLANRLHRGYFADELKVLEAYANHSKFSSVIEPNYPLDVSNIDSTRGDMPPHSMPIDSSDLELPDSPFAFPMGSGISTV